MNEIQDTLNLDESDMNKLPSGLNILTILTYIACGLGMLSAIYSYFTVCKSAEKLANQELPEIGGAFGKFMDASVEMAQKSCENNMLVTLITVVGLVLCFVGAMMMRNLKKQGFILYIIGEIVPPVALLILLGMNGMMAIFGFSIPIIFVILYATQRKYLVN